MNLMKKGIFVAAACVLSSVASAEVVSWQFDGVVDFGVPGVNVGDVISGTVTLETDSTYICCDVNFTHYDDFSSESKIEINVNGVTYESVVNPATPANLFIDQPVNVDYLFNYNSMIASNGEQVDFAAINIITNIPSPFTNPAILPTTPPLPAEINISRVEVCGSIGCFRALLSSVESAIPANQSPVVVDVTNGGAAIAETGGRLYFGRYVTNTAAVELKFKRWANVTWPNGITYNRETPKNITLSPGASSNQAGAYYNIPEYWPAGEYEYHIHTLTNPGGQLSTDSFIFTKN